VGYITNAAWIVNAEASEENNTHFPQKFYQSVGRVLPPSLNRTQADQQILGIFVMTKIFGS